MFTQGEAGHADFREEWGGVRFAQVENATLLFASMRTRINNAAGKDGREQIVFEFVGLSACAAIPAW